MRRFLSSGWFPLCSSLVLALGCVIAVVVLKPAGADVGNESILKAFRIAGYATGPAVGLLAFTTMLLLNGIRRIMRLRSVSILHPIVALVGLAPWVSFGWQLTFKEPRFTAFGRAAIDFVGEPLWWGSLASVIFVLVLSLTLLTAHKK